MSNLVGKTLLDRYNVREFIGRGGMAEVYKVWDSQRMTYLAMKVLLEDLALDRVFIRRFTREANTLANLQHPNIVRFYGFEQEERLAFMLMDYIEGETLKHFIYDAGGKSMHSGQIKTIVRAVCGALHYAHSQGLVHCDIKPANIMIDVKGTVQLADFGIARMSDAATATMVGAGTPAYMAPEQIKGLDPVPQTDIYALGVVLYEMFTGGERPFTGDQAETTGGTGERVRWEHLHLEPPSPKQWNPDISDEIEAVILKCLEKNPRDRYQTAIELINALELALGSVKNEIPFVVPAPVPDEGTEVLKAKAKVILPAGIAIVMLLLLLIPNWATGRSPAATEMPTPVFENPTQNIPVLVSTQRVEKIENPTSTVEEPTPTDAVDNTSYAHISCEVPEVNLRKTPGYLNKNDDTDSLYKIPCGEKLELLGDKEYADELLWWYVYWNGYTGWIAESTGSGRTILIFAP